MSISEINKLKGEEKSEILYAQVRCQACQKQIARVFSIDYHYLCRILRVYAQKVSKRATPIPAGLKEAFVKDTTKRTTTLVGQLSMACWVTRAIKEVTIN